MNNNHNAIFRALYARYRAYPTATATLTATATGTATGDDPFTLTGGRFYRTTAPQGAAYPHAVVSLQGGMLDRMFGGTGVEKARCQIDVYSRMKTETDAAEPMTIMKGLLDAFDNETLPLVDGGTSLIVRRDGIPTEESDGEFTHVSCDFLFERQV